MYLFDMQKFVSGSVKMGFTVSLSYTLYLNLSMCLSNVILTKTSKVYFKINKGDIKHDSTNYK